MRRPALETSLPRNRQPAIPVYEPREETAVVHKAHPHDSARLQDEWT